ncbi:MAG: c-type cytochrome [Bacteroidetes bacterium]|nr:c-type cytochrome [Bacteroidota bacterium]
MRLSSIFFMATAITFLFFTSCNNAADSAKTAAASKPAGDDMVKRGEYLVSITGCNDCHSPKKPGAHGPELIPELLLSGYASATPVPRQDTALTKMGMASFAPDLTASSGPWGITYAANLTPDSTSGIGTWTEEQFKKALTQGKFMGQDGGRMLLPPMPWPNYSKMTDDDVKAIFAYLKSIKPVKNSIPEPVAPGKM